MFNGRKLLEMSDMSPSYVELLRRPWLRSGSFVLSALENSIPLGWSSSSIAIARINIMVSLRFNSSFFFFLPSNVLSRLSDQATFFR